MFKNTVFLIIASVIVVFFKTQVSMVLRALVWCHNELAGLLSHVFSGDNIGQIIQSVVSLAIIPLLVGLLIAAVYWMIKRGKMAYTWTIIWMVWLALLATMVAQAG